MYTQFHVRTHTLGRGARLSMPRGRARPPSVKRVCTAAHTRRRQSAATRFGRLAGRKRSVNVLHTYAATRGPGTLSRSRYNSHRARHSTFYVFPLVRFALVFARSYTAGTGGSVCLRGKLSFRAERRETILADDERYTMESRMVVNGIARFEEQRR